MEWVQVLDNLISGLAAGTLLPAIPTTPNHSNIYILENLEQSKRSLHCNFGVVHLHFYKISKNSIFFALCASIRFSTLKIA